MIGYYNVYLPADIALDVIKDGANTRALNKFPGDWEVDLAEL
jgi:hypothetical protein